MPQATLIDNKGTKVVVESGSQDAQKYFGQGYKLMTNATNPLPQGSLPSTVQAATAPASSIPTEAQGTTGGLGDLRQALSMALSEASQHNAATRINSLSGLIGGGARPSVINAALGLAQQGLARREEDVFKYVMESQTEAQKLQRERRSSALSTMNTMIDNGVFSETPAGALLALEKEAGLSEGTALAWQAKLVAAEKISDEKAKLELSILRKRLSDEKTAESSSFRDVMQDYINAGSSPEEAARKAATNSEALGISVNQETLTKWTEEARKMIPKATESPVDLSTSPPLTAVEAGRKTGGVIKSIPEKFGQGLQDTGVAIGDFFSGLFGY